MRAAWRTITICLAVLFAVAMFSIPQAFAAKASFDSPPGEPPYGLAVHGNAGGTKLYGTIEIEYINPNGTTADVRAVVRLRKGNTVSVFYTLYPWPATSASTGVIFNVDTQDPKIIQNRIAEVLAPQILSVLFPDQTNLCIWLKAASEAGKTALYEDNYLQTDYIFELIDVELAVNTCQP